MNLPPNWKTTTCGLITMIAGALTALPAARPYAEVIAVVSAGMIGLVGKDSNVTGGTVSAATGETLPQPVSLVDTELGIKKRHIG